LPLAQPIIAPNVWHAVVLKDASSRSGEGSTITVVLPSAPPETK